MLLRRWLPAAEWPTKLKGTTLEPVVPLFDPKTTRIVVVEDETGRVCGCVSFYTLFHADGLEKMAEQNGPVWRLLFEALHEAARDAGSQVVVAGVVSEVMRSIVVRLDGERIPGEQYVIPLPCGPFEAKKERTQWHG